MSWIAVGVGVLGAGSSIAGDISRNKAQKKNNEAIRKAAHAQHKIKKAHLDQAYNIQMHELYNMAEEFDREVGVDLTNLLYESEKMKGQITNTVASRNIYGNTSARLQNTAEIQKELSNDMLQQEVQNKYTALGKEINSARLNNERENLDLTMGLYSALSQQNFNFKSPTEIALGGLSSGVSGAMTGHSLGKTFGSSPGKANSGKGGK